MANLTGYSAVMGLHQITMPFQFSIEKNDIEEEGVEKLEIIIVADNSHHLFNYDCPIGRRSL